MVEFNLQGRGGTVEVGEGSVGSLIGNRLIRELTFMDSLY